MSRCLQGFSAVLIAVLLLSAQAAPAVAAAPAGEGLQNRGEVNLVFDAMFLRPLGLVAIGLGSAVWAVGVAPWVALTRPTDLDDSMAYLIMRPVRYTFADPLGHH